MLCANKWPGTTAKTTLNEEQSHLHILRYQGRRQRGRRAKTLCLLSDSSSSGGCRMPTSSTSLWPTDIKSRRSRHSTTLAKFPITVQLDEIPKYIKHLSRTLAIEYPDKHHLRSPSRTSLPWRHRRMNLLTATTKHASRMRNSSSRVSSRHSSWILRPGLGTTHPVVSYYSTWVIFFLSKNWK